MYFEQNCCVCITDTRRIAQEFYKYFSNVGDQLDSNIPYTQGSGLQLLEPPNYKKNCCPNNSFQNSRFDAIVSK